MAANRDRALFMQMMTKHGYDCTTIDNRVMNNLPIKAFTSNGIATTNTKVSFSKSLVKIGKGETYTLKSKTFKQNRQFDSNLHKAAIIKLFQ